MTSVLIISTLILYSLLMAPSLGARRIYTSAETKLMKDLFNGYEKMARPVVNDSRTVDVKINLKITKLEQLNTKDQFISVLGWIDTRWKDERLTWNKSDYNGIDYIAVPATQVWLPTFALSNTASDNLYNEFWYNLFKVNLHHSGSIVWAPGGIFKAACIIDVHLFPFDDQICHFKFENWIYTGDKVNLTFGLNPETELLKYYNDQNGQWDITDVKVIRSDKYYTMAIPYPEVHFGLHLKRKPLFYVTNIILLSVLFAMLVLLMFCLPHESGERISMGMTLLLSFSVFILMVNGYIPETSTSVPVIIIYLISIMALTSVGIAESVIVLYCFHHSGETKPPKFLVTKSKNNDICDMPKDNQKVTIYITDNSDYECNQRLWRNLAHTIDKVFFWITLCSFTSLMIILLFVYPKISERTDIDTASKLWPL